VKLVNDQDGIIGEIDFAASSDGVVARTLCLDGNPVRERAPDDPGNAQRAQLPTIVSMNLSKISSQETANDLITTRASRSRHSRHFHEPHITTDFRTQVSQFIDTFRAQEVCYKNKGDGLVPISEMELKTP
jgi:hypothetical protein